MKNLRSGKIETLYTLLSPLSHIGNSVGPDSYLSTQTVIGSDGEPVETFVYSGNAIRGMLRDAGARYMIDSLGDPDVTIQIPLDVFYLLFSGGSIGGESKIDIDQARRIRRTVPHLSVFGGGVGNQILPGKINVGEGLPVCREFSHILPSELANALRPWRQMTTEQSFTRTDDAKNELLTSYIQDGASGQALCLTTHDAFAELDEPSDLGDPAPLKRRTQAEKQSKKDKPPKDRPQQMRYTVELLATGARIWEVIDYYDMTEIELGALVAAIDAWGKRPVLGGQARVGMGKVRAEMRLYEGGKEPEPFITVDPRRVHLHAAAAGPKKAYDSFLEEYKEYLEINAGNIMKGISATTVTREGA